LENVIKNNQLVEAGVGEVCMTNKLQTCEHEQFLSRFHAVLQHGERLYD